MSALENQLLTPEEYLEIERDAEVKSEFFDGRMRMMAGASTRHNIVSGNIFGELYIHLRGQSCRPFASDQRLLIEATGLFTYPDVSIYCSELHYSGDKPDTLTNPTVIFEVLSPTTSNFDRTDKWEHSQQIPTLTNYVLVWQDKVQVAHYVRQSPDQWLLTTFRRPDDALTLSAPAAVTLPLSAIYAGITLPETNNHGLENLP